MSRRTTLTVICDRCGRISEHEMSSSGFHEQIYTREPYPADWLTVKREGGGDLSPGLFDTPEEAHSAYCKAAKKYFGEFANVG